MRTSIVIVVVHYRFAVIASLAIFGVLSFEEYRRAAQLALAFGLRAKVGRPPKRFSLRHTDTP